MPTGPKGEKRRADVNARAVMIARIAMGEVDGAQSTTGKTRLLRRLARRAARRGLSL
jgi:hypothetical protein